MMSKKYTISSSSVGNSLKNPSTTTVKELSIFEMTMISAKKVRAEEMKSNRILLVLRKNPQEKKQISNHTSRE